jgi:hypothetical protein
VKVLLILLNGLRFMFDVWVRTQCQVAAAKRQNRRGDVLAETYEP